MRNGTTLAPFTVERFWRHVPPFAPALQRMMQPADPSYDEPALVRRLQNHEQRAFAELYDRFAPALWNIARRIVCDDALAEDVLQEAFVKAYQQIDSYHAERGRLFTWLLNITRNRAIDVRRRSKSSKGLHYTDEHVLAYLHANSPNGHAQPAEPKLSNQPTIEYFLLELPNEQHELLKLVYYCGYTHQEAAQALNLPLGTVKSRIRLALAKLRTWMSAHAS